MKLIAFAIFALLSIDAWSADLAASLDASLGRGIPAATRIEGMVVVGVNGDRAISPSAPAPFLVEIEQVTYPSNKLPEPVANCFVIGQLHNGSVAKAPMGARMERLSCSHGDGDERSYSIRGYAYDPDTGVFGLGNKCGPSDCASLQPGTKIGFVVMEDIVPSLPKPSEQVLHPNCHHEIDPDQPSGMGGYCDLVHHANASDLKDKR